MCAVIFGFDKSRRTRPSHLGPIRSLPVDVDRPAAEVWTFLRDPQLTSRYRDDVGSAVTMPGAGEGVGEVRAFVYQRHGTDIGMFIEVVECEPGRRAVHRTTRSLRFSSASPSPKPLVEPVNSGQCRLTHTVIVKLSRRLRVHL